jgi:chromosome segregation protein
MMLEEAAGFQACMSAARMPSRNCARRRANLARLATILGDMDARAQSLKKQARQAERYRKLSGEIARRPRRG